LFPDLILRIKNKLSFKTKVKIKLGTNKGVFLFSLTIISAGKLLYYMICSQILFCGKKLYRLVDNFYLIQVTTSDRSFLLGEFTSSAGTPRGVIKAR
jgi:hypothetical protein